MTNLNFRDDLTDIIILSYKEAEKEFYEVQESYILSEVNKRTGTWEAIEVKERKIPRSEIDSYIKKVTGSYETHSLNEAGIVVEGNKLVEGYYNPSEGKITLTTSPGQEIIIPLDSEFKTSGPGYDKIPDLRLQFNGTEICSLDMPSTRGEIKVITDPKKGKLNDLFLNTHLNIPTKMIPKSSKP